MKKELASETESEKNCFILLFFIIKCKGKKINLNDEEKYISLRKK